MNTIFNYYESCIMNTYSVETSRLVKTRELIQNLNMGMSITNYDIYYHQCMGLVKHDLEQEKDTTEYSQALILFADKLCSLEVKVSEMLSIMAEKLLLVLLKIYIDWQTQNRGVYIELEQLELLQSRVVPVKTVKVVKAKPMPRVINTPIEINRESTSYVPKTIDVLTKAELIVLGTKLGLRGLTNLNKDEIIRRCNTKRSNKHFQSFIDDLLCKSVEY
jgi:hypothetical protein